MDLSLIEPYDPDSEVGRAVAADLTRVIAEVDAEIRQRKEAESAASGVNTGDSENDSGVHG
jgi:hypothetical protein